MRPPILGKDGKEVLHPADVIDMECHIAEDGLFWVEWHDWMQAGIKRMARVVFDVNGDGNGRKFCREWFQRSFKLNTHQF